jgi:hypothetical protein
MWYLVSSSRRVLRRDDDSIDALHLARLRIFDCDLGFAIGAEVRAGTVLANLRKFLAELMRERDGHRHQLGRLVAGEAKHHALVAGASGIDAHGDIARLFVDARDHSAGVRIEAVDGVVIADGLDDSADDLLEVDVSLGGNFAGDNDEAGAGKGFAGDAAHGVFAEAGVENGVGNLVGDFVGMAFGNRLRGKQKTIL